MGEMNCELCGMRASMYCESDKARLCWECDSRVHSANFLVEKHTRALLCHSCHDVTPWTASGCTLGISLTLCNECSISTSMSSILASVNLETERFPAPGHDGQVHDQQDNDAWNVTEGEERIYSDDSDSNEEDDDDDDDEDETDESTEDSEDEDNQVVPWTPEDTLPPGPSSSSSEDHDINPPTGGWRMLRNFVDSDSDLDSEDETSSSLHTSAALIPLSDPMIPATHQETILPSRKRPRTATI